MHFSRISKWAIPALALALVGCTPQAQPNPGAQPPHITEQNGYPADIKNSPAEQHPNRQQVEELHQPNPTQRAPHLNVQTKPQPQSANEMATQIAQTVNRLPGVERAAVLLTGKTALIGVDLAPNVSGSRIDSLKYSVKEAAEHTGYGYNAVVTSDIDTVTRVRNLVNGARQGQPISSVRDEIADIVSRLVPEM